MFFRETNEAEILSLFHKASEIMIDNKNEVLEKSKYYIPSIRSNKMNKYVDEYWVDTIFSLKYVYWKEKGLLGLSGYTFPQELTNLFDCHVEFQNSCDQDYDFDSWSDKISFFKQCKDACIDKSATDIMQIYHADNCDWYSKDEIERELDYHRKTALYNMIFTGLDLDAWLYGRKSEDFVRYSINAIDCIEKKRDINIELQCLVKVLHEDKNEKCIEVSR